MTEPSALRLLKPQWRAAPDVSACVSTRLGGFSGAPYNSLNLATHVGDHEQTVLRNRARLRDYLGLCREPLWLSQTHSNRVHVARSRPEPAQPIEADASITRERGLACAVLTADCVPILLCADDGQEVAAVHAGWRGLDSGIVENTVAAMQTPVTRLQAWIGPCIHHANYEIGDALYARLCATDPHRAQCCVRHGERWHLDLVRWSELSLRTSGVDSVSVSGLCVHDDQRFFSYRRDGVCGRMAALIWINGSRKP